MSGFRKEDKLIPIITATVFLSDDEWDGPMNLHDMLALAMKVLKYQKAGAAEVIEACISCTAEGIKIITKVRERT